MEVRGRSRKNKGRATVRRQIRAWMSMVLTAAMIMGNMAASVNTVLASPSVPREEFRLRIAAIQKAAEKALDEGEGITEELVIDGKDKSVLKEYQELFRADGRLYELDLLKDIETVKDVNGVTLRVFMRLPEEADPKTHVLNGEEELYFLYVNDGDESVSARLNIEGLVSGFSTVRAYEAVFGDKETILENQDKNEETGEAGTEEDTAAAETEENEAAGEGESGEDEGKDGISAGGSGGNGGGSSSAGSGSGNGSHVDDSESSPVGNDESSNETEESNSNKETEETAGSTETEKPEEQEEDKNTDSNDAAEESKEEREEKESSADEADHEVKAEDAEQDDHKTEKDTKTETEVKAENEDSAQDSDKDEKETNGSTSEGNSGNEDTAEKADKPASSENSAAEEKADSSEEKSGSNSSEEKGSSTDKASSDSREEKDSSGEKNDSNDSGSQDSGKEKSEDKTSGGSSDSSSSDKDDSSSSKDSGKSEGNSSDKQGSSSDNDSAGESALNSLGISLNQILRVAEPDFVEADEAEMETETEEEDTEAETEESTVDEEEEDEKEEEKEETDEAEDIDETEPESNTEADVEQTEESINEEDADSDYDEEDRDLTDGEDAEAANMEEEEKDPFEKKGVLKGKIHNLVALEDGLTARVFTTTLEDLGMSKEDLTEGGHILTYTISPAGSAIIVNAPELVRDESEVTFGVVPQVGYRILAVTANGEELETANGEKLASSSNAKKTLASASNGNKGAEYDEDEVVYFTIPKVLESQEVEIFLKEEVEGSHPAFSESKTMSDGVTITVSAEEGILPEGTYLEVEEVTDKVADAVKENVEAGNMATVNAVIAYDINLMLDGMKLSNAYWSGNRVKVEFSGERIKEISENSDQVTIAPIETPTETVEVALGDVEEISVLDDITTENVRVKMDESQTVQEVGDETVNSFSIDAEHFTIYTIVGNSNNEEIIIDEAWNGVYGSTPNPQLGNASINVNGSIYYYNGMIKQVKFKVPIESNEVALSDIALFLADGSKYEGDILGVSISGGEFKKFVIEDGNVYVQFNASGEEVTMPYNNISPGLAWIVSDSVTQKYDLYFYAILPKVQLNEVDKVDNPNENWYGIGLGYISGVRDPKDQIKATNDSYVTSIYDENGDVDRILIDGDNIEITMPDGRKSNLEPYPDIEIDGITYRYSETNEKNTYSIRWIRTVLSDGANTGKNEYFTVDKDRLIYHRDGQLQLNDGLHYTVTFNIQQPNESEFEIQEAKTRRVEEGFEEKNLDKPDTSPKEVGDKTYVFDGWYLDKEFKQKANFKGTIQKDTDYYGRYVPELPKTSTIQIVKSLSDSDQNLNASFEGLEFELNKSNLKWDEGDQILLGEGSVVNKEKIFEFTIDANEFQEGKAYYLLKETAAPDGYQKIDELIKIIVTKDDNGDVKVSFAKVNEDVKVNERATNVINVVNRPVEKGGAILPDTGGPGLAMFERFGWFLLMIALLMAGMEVRCYGERKYRKAVIMQVQNERTEEPL